MVANIGVSSYELLSVTLREYFAVEISNTTAIISYIRMQMEVLIFEDKKFWLNIIVLAYYWLLLM